MFKQIVLKLHYKRNKFLWLKQSLPDYNSLDFNFEIIVLESLTLVSEIIKFIFHHFALHKTVTLSYLGIRVAFPFILTCMY